MAQMALLSTLRECKINKRGWSAEPGWHDRKLEISGTVRAMALKTILKKLLRGIGNLSSVATRCTVSTVVGS